MFYYKTERHLRANIHPNALQLKTSCLFSKVYYIFITLICGIEYNILNDSTHNTHTYTHAYIVFAYAACFTF